ncbi:MAG: T9SS type A sorting domain-containing protein [Ignavibacteriae bacterium]|nr:T9SS type A sorting domain-containing protein [Ignavibacteriota bacterium]
MKKVINTRNIAIAVVALFLVSSLSYMVTAYPTGRTGCTKKTTTAGCSCHTFGTAVTAVFTGPDSVNAGATVIYTLTVTRTGSGNMGCDIAAQIGALAIDSSNLKLQSGELTHTSAQTSNPAIFRFKYTAPATPGKDTLYATVARGYSGNWNWAPNKILVIKTPTGVGNNTTPVYYSLDQNFPNPFNPVTKISYDVASLSKVTLTVFDILGNKVATLVDKKQEAGSYTVDFSGTNLSSGMYLYKIEAGGFTAVKKMTLVK